MALTSFVDKVTTITHTWLNKVDVLLVTVFGEATTVSEARTALGLGTSDSPQFTGVNIGHATDTTITRASAGDIAVEGNTVYRAGGTDIAVADGGTNIGSYTQGDILYASGATTLSKLAVGTATQVLTGGSNPAYGDVPVNGLTEDTSPDLGADFILTYDVSGTTNKKVLLGRVGAGVLGTEQATTSGTAIDFTGIPSWAKKINIMFVGVDLNGGSDLIIQLGDSGGIETTGYLGSGAKITNGASPTAANFTGGFAVGKDKAATNVMHGRAVLSLEDAANFTWVFSSGMGASDSGSFFLGGGSKSLSAALDRVRITAVNGTDAFEAGAINISYE